MYVPDWNLSNHDDPNRREKNLAMHAIGQDGSSTRQELIAWIISLTLKIRFLYATDSAAMKDKVEQMLQRAKKMEDLQMQGRHVNWTKPFKKPFNVQRDGDLWAIAWKAIVKR